MLTEQELIIARDITGKLDCQCNAALVVSVSNDCDVRMLVAGDEKSIDWLREQVLKGIPTPSERRKQR